MITLSYVKISHPPGTADFLSTRQMLILENMSN